MNPDPVSNPHTNQDHPLAALRAQIDDVDAEILDRLAQRHRLIANLAELKRMHGLPIRDAAREAEIFSSRRETAGRLGIAPELVESLYRLILLASRDRQAALKAELPVHQKTYTVAIIGGAGGMGRRMAQLFTELGHSVLVSDLDTPLTPRAAAGQADVVILCVPIDVTNSVIDEVGPVVRADGVLMDITSIKQEPVRRMCAATRASVVGTHPLFGPAVHTLQGQRVALTRGRGDDWFAWVEQTLRARGLQTIECTPEEHDRAMAIVQVLVHFATETMGLALSNLGVSLQRTLEFTSPIYLMELVMTARHFSQSAGLYAAIQMFNPQTPDVTAAFLAAGQRLRDLVVNQDRGAFDAAFADVRRFFGEFSSYAQDQSNYLIDRLVERM